jgi:drug/metabolite transporter (DMT)-like permease
MINQSQKQIQSSSQIQIQNKLSKTHEALIIVLLAAIWGSSFLFMRILVIHMQPIVMANLRILIAGICIFFVYTIASNELSAPNSSPIKNYKQYLFAGILNSAIPFTLYGFAAVHLPAGYSAILNALTPLFACILAAIYLGQALTKAKILAMILGFSGVLVLMWPKIMHSSIDGIKPILAIIACVGATLCYGLGSTYAKKELSHCNPASLACYTQISAGIVMLPLWIFNTEYAVVANIFHTSKLLYSLLTLAILCSSIAYVLFFYLIKHSGTVKATSTTFIIPLFGIFWAYLFLDEALPHTAYISAVLIVMATILVLKK